MQLSELATLKAYIEHVAQLMAKVTEPDEKILKDALAPLLEDFSGEFHVSETPPKAFETPVASLQPPVEPHADVTLGDRFRLALYGADSPDPLIVRATVSRDDGDGGLALRFDALSHDAKGDLEKLVACLPDLDSLREGEAFGLGAVVGEVLEGVAPDVGEADANTRPAMATIPRPTVSRGSDALTSIANASPVV